MNLCDYIREGRKSKHYTQEALAEKLNISVTHLKHIESGHRNPSVEVLFQLVSILNLSLDSLLFPEPANNSLYEEAARLLRKCNDAEKRILIATMTAMRQENPLK